MESDLKLKWLGLAGLELKAGGGMILIDPVFTRVPAGKALFGTIAPDKAAVRGHGSRCGDIFITHAHYDHLIDAPLLSSMAGAAMHGSANACAIAGACGVPGGKLNVLTSGSMVKSGAFTVTALPASHIRLPGFGYGGLPGRLAPPLRAAQYRMDESFVFLIQAGGLRLLAGPGLCLSDPGAVDILLCCPLYLGNRLAEYVGRIHPRVFMPIHWEDMFRPAKLPPVPGMAPRFPFRRIDMEGVKKQAEALGIKYFMPERHREYQMDELLCEYSKIQP